MTLSLIGKYLLLDGSTLKTKDKQVPCIYIYIYLHTHIYTRIEWEIGSGESGVSFLAIT